MSSLSILIGLRYLRAKRRNRFISFISLISMFGIGLGVMVLITVMAVMNGFDTEIQNRVFGMANHITVLPYSGLKDWQSMRQQLIKQQHVVAAAPLVKGQGMLTNSGSVHAALVTGIDPKLEQHVSIVGANMVEGKLENLTPGSFGIVLGEQLAMSLGVMQGDKVVLVTPKAAVTVVGIVPTYKRFTVVGTFKLGNGFAFDRNYAYINLQDAQHLYSLGNRVSGLRLKIDALYQAPYIARDIMNKLGRNVRVQNWTQQFGPLFKAISMEKNMLFLVLLMIIAVAIFNLVSSLVMLVMDKQSDIAVLRTLGATPGTVMRIFIVQGTVIGIIGTALGIIGGVLLSMNVTAVVTWLQQVLHMQLISSGIYYLDYLPSEIHSGDIIRIGVITLVMAMLATLYPAWRAAKIQPAEALRYE